MLLRIVVFALVVWLVISVLGFLIKGLLWLAIVGIILFLVTGAVGAVRARSAR